MVAGRSEDNAAWSENQLTENKTRNINLEANTEGKSRKTRQGKAKEIQQNAQRLGGLITTHS